MKKRAIISTLWERNREVLFQFMVSHPDYTALILEANVTQALLNAFNESNIHYVIMSSLLSPEEIETSHGIADDLKRQAGALRFDTLWKSFCQKIAVPEVQFTNVVAASFSGIANEAVLAITMLEKSYAQFDIQLITVNEDVTVMGRLFCAWGKARGIPSLLVAHGTLISKAYTVHKGLFADIAAVFSERGAESYLDIGVPQERLQIVGNPAWDHYPRLIQERPMVKQLLFGKYQLPTLPLITFGTIWGHYFSALLDESIYRNTLEAFIAAIATMKKAGIQFQAVVKDRVENQHIGNNCFNELLEKYNLDSTQVRLATADTEALVVSSDVVVAVDSNLSIEAMMAGVPTINLLNSTGLALGPSFDAHCGILEVEADELAETLARLLLDQSWRNHCVDLGQKALPRYSAGMDGQSALRVVQLMQATLKSSNSQYVWQQFLDVEEIEASQYHEVPRVPLVEMFERPPRVALDIGCGAGATLRLVKERYPQARTIGIELSRSAGKRAATVADQVLIGAFDDFVLTEHGIPLGSIDTVILGDVLEHMYNPWSTMVNLKPYLSEDAQVIISIPNVRNLALMDDLARGYWRYDSAGLLDITHVRFFTLKEFRRFLKETGYKSRQLVYALDSRLNEFYSKNRKDQPIDIDLERMMLKQVGPEELQELCSLQFYIRANPRREGDAEEDGHGYSPSSVFSAPVLSDMNAFDYPSWLVSRQFGKTEAEQFDLHMTSWRIRPRIQVWINAIGIADARLTRTLTSLQKQYYESDCITVISDHPCPVGLDITSKFKWIKADQSWDQAANTLLDRTEVVDDAAWAVAIQAGDTFEPHALLMAAEKMCAHPDWRLVYVDEDSLDDAGNCSNPTFKPELNMELLLSYPYFGDALFFRLDAFAEIGRFRSLAGVERHDLALRMVASHGQSAVGHMAYLLHHHDVTNPGVSLGEVMTNAPVAVRDYFDKVGIRAEVLPGMFPGSFQIQYLFDDVASISILIAVGDQLESLQQCLESLLAKPAAKNHEIVLLASGAESPEMLAYLEGLEALGSDKLRIFSTEGGISLSGLHNMLASQARGEYLLFMHHDTVAITDYWADSLLQLCRSPGTVAVAPRRLLPDGTVRSGGVILGLGTFAEPPFAGLKLDNSGYMNRAHLTQEFSALSAGCLIIRAESFFEVGGFNEKILDASVAATELCARLGSEGGRLIWTPHVSVMTHDTATTSEWPGTNVQEADRSKTGGVEAEKVLETQLQYFTRDPAYNPNLSLTVGPFVIEERREFNWSVLDWHPLPRIVSHYADNMGCGQYRILAPTRELNSSGKAQVWSSGLFESAVELAGLEVDSLIFQRPVLDYQIKHLQRCQKLGNAFVVFEIDDLMTNLPEKSIHAKDVPADIGKSLKSALKCCDRFVVSTEYLKETYAKYHDDIVVVPNYIEYSLWKDLKPQRRTSPKPRVGWVGGVGHTGDLELIVNIVSELSKEVDWVFMGMCPEPLMPYVKEFYTGVPFLDYPAKMVSLNLDLALAPLEMHPFNKAKSHLRLLEYGILGLPVICTDILPYQGDYPVTRVKNRAKDWIKAIREHINDPDEMDKRGQQLKRHILDHWLLHDHLDEWLRAWTRI